MAPAVEPRLKIIGERTWTGVRASLVETSTGLFVGRPASEPSLMFHLGPEARVRYRYDRQSGARLQTRGDFDIIAAGATRSWYDSDPTSTMSLWIEPSYLEQVSSSMRGPARRRLPSTLVQKRDVTLFRLAQLLQADIVGPAQSDALFSDSLGTALVVRLIELYGEVSLKPGGAVLNRRQLQTVIDYVNAHLADPIGLDDLAALVHLSPSYFRALFRQTVGVPVHQYVVSLRLDKARTLLQGQGLPAAQVALETGFCHQSHLARAMRRYWGLTPREVARMDAGPWTASG